MFMCVVGCFGGIIGLGVELCELVCLVGRLVLFFVILGLNGVGGVVVVVGWVGYKGLFFWVLGNLRKSVLWLLKKL